MALLGNWERLIGNREAAKKASKLAGRVSEVIVPYGGAAQKKEEL